MAASNCIGITLGDVAGIGPEVVDAALASGKLDTAFTYRVIGERGSASAASTTSGPIPAGSPSVIPMTRPAFAFIKTF